MYRPFFFLTLSVLTGIAQAQSDPSQEPPAVIELEAGGKTVNVLDGATFELNGITGTARVSPVKTLAAAHLSFDYPRHFAFEYDGSTPGMGLWTLDGNSVVVTLSELPEGVTPKDMEEGMVERFGRSNCRTKDLTLRLGGQELRGRRMDVTLVGERISIDILQLPSADGMGRLVMLQDTMEEGKANSTEYKETVQLLDRTIRYDRP